MRLSLNNRKQLCSFLFYSHLKGVFLSEERYFQYVVSAHLKMKSAKCLTEVPERLAKGPRSFRAQSNRL